MATLLPIPKLIKDSWGALSSALSGSMQPDQASSPWDYVSETLSQEPSMEEFKKGLKYIQEKGSPLRPHPPRDSISWDE